MLKKSLVLVTVIICLTNLMGCGLARQWKIESELKDLNPQKEASRQRLETLKQKVVLLQNQSSKLTTDLNSLRNDTMTVLKNNPGTVACIASGAVALSDGNYFSKDVKELGATIGLVCLGFYIFSEDFQKSADNLVESINSASERAQKLQSQINTIKPKIEAGTRDWQTENKLHAELSQKITHLESELAELKR